ncbi:MAG: PPOX class F420-dependent oxidoreductase [Actinomycetota bacterium]|nr:PPOX class F420-dependent oxidoreductase [Actinomycetota bacterium]
MTPAETREFLRAGTRTGKLATVSADGSPHVAPIWFELDDDGNLFFSTGENTVKGRNLRREPRLTLCVDDENPPFAHVVLHGVAEISEDLGDLLAWSTKIGGRYMGADRAEEFGRRNAVQGELLVRVTPSKIVALRNIAD